MTHFKKNSLYCLLILSIGIFCLLFANKDYNLEYRLKDEIVNLSQEDIIVNIIDEDTIKIENSIAGNGISYSWKLLSHNGRWNEVYNNMLTHPDHQSIEFTYYKLEGLCITSVIEYDGVKYTSDKFVMDANGNLSIAEDSEGPTTEKVEVITRDVRDIVSIAYVAFLVAVAVVYYILPKKFQWIVLLVASLIFYTLSGAQYIIFILASAGITFFSAKQMAKNIDAEAENISMQTDMKIKKEIRNKIKEKNKDVLWMGLIVSIGMLLFIKYTQFALENINSLLNIEIPMVDLIMPLGLSFYTFILVAYIFDVYREKIKAEDNFFKFFLFVSFFPQISQGPIARYKETSVQFFEKHSFDYQNFCFSAQRILWGFFIKLVLADRIALFVSPIYQNYTEYSWFMVVLASLAYSIQVYADFYSSMEIAIGSAQVFGIKLSENFMRPYFATNMPEFWRRWHISLGTFFKDYVFFPVSINPKLMKFSVNMRKKYGANVSRVLSAIPPIMAVWILTGLWHGSSWKFVAWGLFHGVLIVLSTIFTDPINNLLTKIGVKTQSIDYKIFQMAKVFLLCTIGRVFFRADSFTIAIDIFKHIFTFQSPTPLINLAPVGLASLEYYIIIIAVIMLFIVSLIQETHGSVRETISKMNFPIRWIIWLGLIFGVVIFGKYGLGTVPIFIYNAF